MKRTICLFLAVLCAFTVFAACKNTNKNNNDNKNTTGTDVSDVDDIKWQSLPDPDAVASWKLADTDSDETYLLTIESKIRSVAKGSVYNESDIRYGTDKKGNKWMYSESYLLQFYGINKYEVKDDTLTITRENDDGTTEEYKFVKTDYTPVKLVAPDNLKVDDKLVGSWYNEEFEDGYIFTDDGVCTYSVTVYDQNFVYDMIANYTYTADEGKITRTLMDNSGKTQTETVEYYFANDTLYIDGNDYKKK